MEENEKMLLRNKETRLLELKDASGDLLAREMLALPKENAVEYPVVAASSTDIVAEAVAKRNHHIPFYYALLFYILLTGLFMDVEPEYTFRFGELVADLKIRKRDEDADDAIFGGAGEFIVAEYKPGYVGADFAAYSQAEGYANARSEDLVARIKRDKSIPEEKKRGMIADAFGISMILFCHRIARELEDILKANGIELVEEQKGVYHLKGSKLRHDEWIVVLPKLEGEEMACFRLLTRKATKKDYEYFDGQARELFKKYPEIVSVVYEVTREFEIYCGDVYDEIVKSLQEKKTKEDSEMLDSIIFMDSAARQALFDEQRATGRQEGINEVLSALREFCQDGFADEFIAFYNAQKNKSEE